MIRFGVLTVSDRSSRKEREDLSGPAIELEITNLGWQVSKTGIVPDEEDQISHILKYWVESRGNRCNFNHRRHRIHGTRCYPGSHPGGCRTSGTWTG